MVHTFTQLHIHLVFAVKYRESLILPLWKDQLHKYITGIVEKCNQKMLQINSMPDHVHMLIGLRPDQTISALVQTIKTNSNVWVNQSKFSNRHFAWQEGYGAFACSKSAVHQVISYIQNQEKHHAKMSFLHEYKLFLENSEIQYDERYIFKNPV